MLRNGRRGYAFRLNGKGDLRNDGIAILKGCGVDYRFPLSPKLYIPGSTNCNLRQLISKLRVGIPAKEIIASF